MTINLQSEVTNNTATEEFQIPTGAGFLSLALATALSVNPMVGLNSTSSIRLNTTSVYELFDVVEMQERSNAEIINAIDSLYLELLRDNTSLDNEFAIILESNLSDLYA